MIIINKFTRLAAVCKRFKFEVLKEMPKKNWKTLCKLYAIFLMLKNDRISCVLMQSILFIKIKYMSKITRLIIIYLLKIKIKKAQKKLNKSKYDFLIKAYLEMIDCYKNTILSLKADNR